jgi:hypothetical protein
MGSIRNTTIAPASIVSLIVLVAVPGTTYAWGHRHHPRHAHDARVGYAASIQSVYQFPAALVGQPTLPYGYTVPIQSVYQFPAALVSQPGAFLPPPPSIEGYGTGHYIIR